MSAIDVFVMCIRQMFKRKLRTFLTILGVMVGTAAIILMISLGLATDAHFNQMLDDMEQDLTVITVERMWGTQAPDGTWTANMNPLELEDHVFEQFSRIEGVRVATPMMRGEVVLRSGRYSMWAWSVMGVNPEALPYMGFDLQWGRLLEPGDEYTAVFGWLGETQFMDWNLSWERREDRTWPKMSGEEVDIFVDLQNDHIDLSYDQRLIWGGGDDDSEEIDLYQAFRPVTTITLNVVGELYQTGNWMVDQGLVMSIDVLQSLALRAEQSRQEQMEEWGHFSALRGGGERIIYDQGMVMVNSLEDTSRVAAEITEMGFWVQYAGQRINMLREQQAGLQMMLAAIAAVSLFVAAIGIANTMIMAVYERTREIGIMKVIGAAISDVRKLFLLEAALIGFWGGVFGIIMALIGSYLLNNADLNLMGAGAMLMGEDMRTSLITPWLCGLALVFASVIGLVSGYLPARRATKLSALAAIRSE